MFFIRKLLGHIEARTIRKQGGEQTSALLRKLSEKRYNVIVGMYSYGSCFDKTFNTGGKVIIGRYSSFGPDVRYFGANHPLNFFSTSPYFYRQYWTKELGGGGGAVEDVERHCLIIENDVWIGSGVKITCGCKSIGNGAVVGAGSVVTKDIPPYAVVAGNPARIIKNRFTDEQINKLEESKWFELTPDILLRFYEYRTDPVLFSEKILEYRQNKENNNIEMPKKKDGKASKIKMRKK